MKVRNQSWDHSNFICIGGYFVTESFRSAVDSVHPLTLLGDGVVNWNWYEIQVSNGVASALGDDGTMLIEYKYTLWVKCHHQSMDTKAANRNER